MVIPSPLFPFLTPLGQVVLRAFHWDKSSRILLILFLQCSANILRCVIKHSVLLLHPGVVKTEPEISTDSTDDETLKIKKGNRRKSPSGWNTFEDAALSGWKFKSDNPGMSGHCRYLSPDGDYLNGRLQVLKFMKDNNVGAATIGAIRKTFRTATKELFLNKLP